MATIARPALAQTQPAEKLGTIAFPTSANAAAQPSFIKGMLLYYSFEYDRSAAAFRDAEKADPSFALAYWGEALTYTHQVWDQQDLGAARAALNRLASTPAARRAKAKTEREKMFMDLAEALYGPGSKPRRDTLFNAAAERLSDAYPNDDEPKVLHALGLLGLNQGVRDYTTYMQAGAIAEGVLRHNPDHPAAAHFTIHAFDDPVHAPLGLWAARLYSKIAPGAPHAQHMTTHIFLAMGMWDDVISQNIVASGPKPENYHAGHYTWWLEYGYVEAGRYNDALRVLATARKNLGATPRPGEGAALQMMRAHYVIDAERWEDTVATWDLSRASASPYGTPTDLFVSGMVALHSDDVPRADSIAARLAKAPPRAPGAPVEAAGASAILAAELRAAILSGTNHDDEAIALLRRAVADEDALPLEFGPPYIPKPTSELLGEVLLDAGKAAEAKAAFEHALARAPGRPRSLIGLARAASVIGDNATINSAVDRLEAIWHAADAGLPERDELPRILGTRKP